MRSAWSSSTSCATSAKGFTSVSELAAIRQISRPAISQAVDVLVEKGLISRQQEAEDRRFVHLLLTPNGEALLNKIFQENRAWMMEKCHRSAWMS